MEKFTKHFNIFNIYIINHLWQYFAECKKKRGYSLFIEFSNAYGLKEGTSITLRGVNIGYVQSLKININSVLVIAYINSTNILIPKQSIIETNQTSLFNNTIIDIVPLVNSYKSDFQFINVLDKGCYESIFLCNYQYVLGHRGLNYDDLIRATTRIVQRFDDPRLFNFLYLFIYNNLEILDEFPAIINSATNIVYLFYYVLNSIFLHNL